MKPPVPLRELRELDPELARALEPGAVEPTAGDLAQLAQELGAALGTTLAAPAAATLAKAGAGGVAAASATKVGWGFGVWVLGGAVLGVGLSGAVALSLSSPDSSTPAIAASPSRVTAAPAGSILPASPEPVPPAPAEVAPRLALPRASASPSAPEAVTRASDRTELSLLKQAQASIVSNPALALSLVAQHEQEFVTGLLAQEREVLAIDALVRLGRAGEARARASGFEHRYPASAHQRRIDQLLAGAR